MAKRTLDSFFQSEARASKRAKFAVPNTTKSSHSTYPHDILDTPADIKDELTHRVPKKPGREINDQPHLDLVYFQPFIDKPVADRLFALLRYTLPFYRVQYTIRRAGVETTVNTPRFTTVFGVDSTSYFSPDERKILLDSSTHRPVAPNKYKCTPPRPIPQVLDFLRQRVEAVLGDGTTFNFCLVNYYASGDDSISYHSDDERFLGPNPTIASLSLGEQRDFLMKHKPDTAPRDRSLGKPLKLALSSGDMVVMRGETQSNWLHSIPKRSGKTAPGGRINITFRKAIVPGGTENYYRYNVGKGEMYRWDDDSGGMKVFEDPFRNARQ
ncbi:hypothetical protein VTN31DRAFT_6459 [Thermomyces dupontii]|uniref:uncharacterized protein n=1 Tax=Talaromyces thermophilus TaxID=28565 RepID=UPI0037423A74